MPIKPIALQRRHAELGRIRLGDKGGKGQPQKLQRFRFTSPHERHIRDLAQLYGGQARAWTNGTRPEWEVYSEAQTIPVIVVRGGVSQWLESWSGGGCQRRCDGETETLTDSPCLCAGESRERVCKPTTRLSVMLRDLDAIGVWRLESHGWNAAAELPGMVELAQHVADLVPARLMLSERVTVSGGRTNRFVVPGLDLEVAPSRLAEIVSGQRPAIESSAQAGVPAARAAIEAPAERPDYAGDAQATDDLDVVRAIWTAAVQAGHMDEDLKRALQARVTELLNAPDPQPHTGDPGDMGEGRQEEADPNASGDVDAVWMQVLTVAGQLDPPLDSFALDRVYAQHTGGLLVADATAGQLQSFLVALRNGLVTT